MKIIKLFIREIKNWVVFIIGGIPGSMGNRIRALCYAGVLKSCGRQLTILPSSYLQGCRHISIGDYFCAGVNLQMYSEDGKGITIGHRVSCNSNVMLNANCGGSIYIGSYVVIGPNVVLRASNHRYERLDVPIVEQGHTPGVITIEDDVWLGANVVVLPGVTIGKGSVIGAGSVVTKNIPSFSVAVGAPACVIKQRTKHL